jgi:flavin reductase
MTDPLDDGFRKAMRTLTSAVTIISTECGSRRFGMTATAVTSLSMAPPSLLACVNMSASIHAPLLESGAFCVNVLHANQVDVAEAFSSKKSKIAFPLASGHGTAERLISSGHRQTSPAEIEASYVHGTHRIFIGRVLRVRVREQVNPLIYQDGRYTVGLGDGVDWVVPSV